jgi:hypothetical protein
MVSQFQWRVRWVSPSEYTSSSDNTQCQENVLDVVERVDAYTISLLDTKMAQARDVLSNICASLRERH